MKFFGRLGGISVWLFAAFLAGASHSSRAQDVPSPPLLESMIDQLVKADTRPTLTFKSTRRNLPFAFPETGPFTAGEKTDQACNMQHFDMTLTNGDESNTFSVLLDPQDGGQEVTPRYLFAKTTVLHVDADGSPRAYHPNDPLGKGTCHLTPGPTGGYVADGACAIDQLANASIHLFRNGVDLKDESLEQAWKGFWPLIRDRKVKPFDLSGLPPTQRVKSRYAFHDPSTDLMVWFNRDIIPEADGYPCVRGPASRFPGYFVAATALSNAKDQPGSDISNADLIAPKVCTPLRFINAELVPFFVLPGNGIGKINVGDVVIAHAVISNEERIVYAVAADSGPSQSFGEASVALSQKLLAKQLEPIVNNKALNSWDISGNQGDPAEVQISILIIGGTKDEFKGEYTSANVEAISRQALQKWNGSDPDIGQRLRSCARQAAINGK